MLSHGNVREILRVQTPKEVPGAPEHLLAVTLAIMGYNFSA
ncbi:MAG: hypothetical protein WAM04_17400 [Candidatus Sulfotelmatobacter sp.]